MVKLYRFLGLGIAVGLMIGLVSTARAGEEPLHAIGIGAHGESIDEVVDGGRHAQEFRAIVDSVSDSSLRALNRAERRNPWKLQTLVVGIGVGAEFGIGPILKVKATPRLRVVFSRGNDPVLP